MITDVLQYITTRITERSYDSKDANIQTHSFVGICEFQVCGVCGRVCEGQVPGVLQRLALCASSRHGGKNSGRRLHHSFPLRRRYFCYRLVPGNFFFACKTFLLGPGRLGRSIATRNMSIRLKNSQQPKQTASDSNDQTIRKLIKLLVF